MNSKILVVGSIAYDSVETPSGKVSGALGGSANYFGLSASLFSQVRVVGVVGEDYKKEDIKLLTDRGVDVEGVEKVAGKTFHWAGTYMESLNDAKTLKTELNVFEKFHPKLPESYRDSEYLFLANIDPVLQAEVLEQVKNPRVVAADTMNFWISSKLPDLKRILKKLDVLLINENEAKMLTGTQNAIAAAAEVVQMGPKSVVIKRGEYGTLIYTGNQYFALPAFPIRNVVDPTGAGDTFAGGFMGYLSKYGLKAEPSAIKMASVYGTLMASFTVQDFSVGALKDLTMETLEQRHLQFREIVSVNP